MTLKEQALKLHKDAQGKISIECKVPVKTREDLSLAYSPGVAEPCMEIHNDYDKIYDYTAKGNLVAVVTNGTAVLGLGDIGAGAGLPVMEGKGILFKSFGGVDAFPICLNTKDPEEIIRTVKLMEPTFGGVNLEDIGAPDCFYIEEKLKEICDIPVFHDDQHGTAIVCAAATINALKLQGKKAEDLKVAVNGCGAAAISVSKLIMALGVKDITLCDSKGAVYKGRANMRSSTAAIAEITNPNMIKGTLADVVKDADMFLGCSVADVLTPEMVKTMKPNPIVFAMANPNPEIKPELAKEAGVAIMGTGRSDYPNQINNVLAFPGIFRGALDVHARKINEEMKMAAAEAIASLVSDEELNPEYIIPSTFDDRVAPAVAANVARVAIETGVARKTDITPEMVAEHTRQLVGSNK
ncbi:MAG: NAD-dependent malic enzyme [Oscillospiraceae bacterium]|nr:NAD-dependent malic enzyme [Oscillospiraceae bacterium]